MPRQIVHQGRKIRVAVDSFTHSDGTPGIRDVILHPGAVAILPMVDKNHVCLVRQERPVIGETLLEIPAGTLEPGEAPEKAAVRELEEETGYQASRWRKLGSFYPSPGVMTECTHLFVAEELRPGTQNLDQDEELTPEIVRLQDLTRWARDGTIKDAKTLIAVLLWEQMRSD